MRTSLLWCGLLVGAAAMAYGADTSRLADGQTETRSAVASRVYPPNPPNDGILFVDHAKNNRGGHLGHALVQYAPGKLLAFYPNVSTDNNGHSAVGWTEFKRSDGSGKQRLLIQASHAYENHQTNVLHWWLEPTL